MKKIWHKSRLLCLFLAMVFSFAQNIYGADEAKEAEAPLPAKPPQLTLVEAVMCEGLEELAPVNETIIFSAALGSVICFTAFDPVPEKTVVYHNWFKRDQSEKNIKLTLKTPRWSTFSKISVRNMDVGPWRVEIVDDLGKVLQTLRFSVTE